MGNNAAEAFVRYQRGLQAGTRKVHLEVLANRFDSVDDVGYTKDDEKSHQSLAVWGQFPSVEMLDLIRLMEDRSADGQHNGDSVRGKPMARVIDNVVSERQNALFFARCTRGHCDRDKKVASRKHVSVRLRLDEACLRGPRLPHHRSWRVPRHVIMLQTRKGTKPSLQITL